MIARLFARFRRQRVPTWRPGEGERVVLLSPSREIADLGDWITLSPAQLAALRQATREREDTIVRNVLQQPDYPPLPACPECGTVAERIDSRMEVPAFGQLEDVMLVNFTPCGHRFRAVVPVDGLPEAAGQ